MGELQIISFCVGCWMEARVWASLYRGAPETIAFASAALVPLFAYGLLTYLNIRSWRDDYCS